MAIAGTTVRPEARAGMGVFIGFCALLFAASATATVMLHDAMSAMGAMPMPGGWTMSMAWMRMCGQTWAGAAASFVGMWVVMMAAMMLPSLAPMLWRYRMGVGATACHARLTALAGTAYFVVWTALGSVIFAAGAALAALATQWPALARAMPMLAGVTVLIAGALQFTAWKARQLACSRHSPIRTLAADAGTAWRYGLRLALHCSYCCAGMTAILLAVGVMDLRAMAVITAAITAERLAPDGERAAKAIGVVASITGVLLVAQAVGLA